MSSPSAGNGACSITSQVVILGRNEAWSHQLAGHMLFVLVVCIPLPHLAGGYICPCRMAMYVHVLHQSINNKHAWPVETHAELGS